MNSEIISLNNRQYIVLDLERVSQKSRSFYVGKIRASELVNMFTVSPTNYDIEKNTSLSNSFVSDADYYRYLVDNLSKNSEIQGFQRIARMDRAESIKDFLEQEEYPFFPNTIIASCDLINDIEEAGLSDNSTISDFEALKNKPDHLSFIFKDEKEKKTKILIPYVENSVLVIDGQHRLEGLKKCSVEFQRNYDVLVSFIVGYDRSVIAKQFYKINYEQKSVNRSLLLHLMAEFSQELDETTFLHTIVKIFNEHESSPFRGRIKMLGVTPSGAEGNERQQYSISQAFLIDHMNRFIDRRAIDSKNYMPIFLYYYQNPDIQIEMIRFLVRYFSAIRSLKPEWEDPKNSLLSKGMGVGAFLIALHSLFPVVFIRDLKSKPENISQITQESLQTLLSGIAGLNFTKTGEFAGAGSSGTVSRIKEQILKSINFVESGEKEKFRTWLRDNTK